MTARAWNHNYRQEAEVLGRIGQLLVHADMPTIEVRLPRGLAEAAVAAWEREDDVGSLTDETCEERISRRRAGALALIGLSITVRGRWDGESVVVELHPVFIGNAVDAADDLPDCFRI
jgi:hypothetical protein